MNSILTKILEYSECSNHRDDGLVNDTSPVIKISSSNQKLPCILIFSKGRPFQLYQLLRSITEFVLDYSEIFVILSTSTSNRDVYLWVTNQFNSVNVVEEVCFANDLYSLFSTVFSNVKTVLFAVDDLIFLNPMSLVSLEVALLEDPKAFCVHSKLHPGIVYSHPAQQACRVPILTNSRKLLSHQNYSDQFDSSKTIYRLLLSFSYAGAECDWKYPFDLCGGLYRVSDVLEILNESSSPITNPNMFELIGNQYYWSKLSKTRSCAFCPSNPMLSVVTVNRVQDTFDVPIFDSVFNNVDEMNSLIIERGGSQWYCSKNYDLVSYSMCLAGQSSVHTGEVLFEGRASDDHEDGTLLSNGTIPRVQFSNIQISVLLPIFNGEKYVKNCIESLLASQGCSFEIIVMDDGSTDRTLDILRRIEDNVEDFPAGCKSFKIYSETHRGLTTTLDCGLSHCSSSLVARMDVDDYSFSHRLALQYHYMCKNPNIHILGGQVFLWKESIYGSEIDSNSWKDKPLEIAGGLAISPVLNQWNSLFRCPLIHSTVCFRKDVILACGGYSGDVSSQSSNISSWNEKTIASVNNTCEDYDLWTRVALKYPFSIANIPSIVGILRLHSSSKSSQSSHDLVLCSNEVRMKLTRHLFNLANSTGKKLQHSSVDFYLDKSSKEYSLNMKELFLCTYCELDHESLALFLSFSSMVANPAMMAKSKLVEMIISLV